MGVTSARNRKRPLRKRKRSLPAGVAPILVLGLLSTALLLSRLADDAFVRDVPNDRGGEIVSESRLDGKTPASDAATGRVRAQVDELNVRITDYHGKGPSDILLERDLYKRGGLRLSLTMGCSQRQVYGAGNALARVFTTRLLALATNSTFSFHCDDLPPNVPKQDLCSKLADGNFCLLTQFEADTTTPESREGLLPHVLPDGNLPALLRACSGAFPHINPYCLGNYSQSIVRDIRAIAKKAEITHGIQRDDVVIHFRCGDYLGTGGSSGFAGDLGLQGQAGYGLIPHSFYVDRISTIDAAIGSIAIVTQPFDRTRTRPWEGGYAQKCEVIVNDLKKYLEEKFPAADVHIRNAPEEGETSYTSFVRLVLAREASFCGPSSFCTTAVLSTLAERGYIFAMEPWPQFAVKIHRHVRAVKGGPIMKARGVPLEDLLRKLRDTKFEENARADL